MSKPAEPRPAAQARVLVAEDDAGMRAVLRFNIEEEGYQVTEVSRGDDAVGLLPPGTDSSPAAGPPFDLVISDVKMPGADGLEVLRAARACHPAIRVVLVTAFGTVEHAIQAMNLGAADYISKPFHRVEFKARIARLREFMDLERENRELRAEIVRGERANLITASPRMLEILRVIERVAPSDATLLLSGETGTGKEILARHLHAISGRLKGPFVAVNCAAIPGELLESELFGHERGAFTGAERLHRGRFEQADGGTLFLDEIGELGLSLQAKILRVLEEDVVHRLGSQEPVPVNVRVAAATNRDLAAEVKAGRFREDLFHRLSVVPVQIPPLRERPEDVPLLAAHFLKELGVAGKVSLAPGLLEEIKRRPWPGNVRELRNLIERMVLLRSRDVLDLLDLAPPGSLPPPGGSAGGSVPSGTDRYPLRPGKIELPGDPFSLHGLEDEIIQKALERHQGNRSAAARYLGIPRHVLLYRLSKSGK